MASLATHSFQDLTVERRRNNVFIITLHRGDENKLTGPFYQEIMKAFHLIHRAVVTRGSNEKFWCTGIELEDEDPWLSSDGFTQYALQMVFEIQTLINDQMLAMILDFPFPTVACVTGHTFGGGCPFALAHDYRVMNSSKGFDSSK